MIEFETDEDRDSWRAYAAAALNGILSAGMPALMAPDAVRNAAKYADEMLVEEQRRRDPTQLSTWQSSSGVGGA